MVQSLAGQTVLISGASSGIGAACAELLATLGVRSILLARRASKLQEVIDHPSLISKFKSKLAAPNNFSDVVNRYHQVYEEKLALVIQGN